VCGRVLLCLTRAAVAAAYGVWCTVRSRRHPEKRQLTFAHAREMCEALDNLWANLENLTKNPGKYLSK
jgi:hypothetical protein